MQLPGIAVYAGSDAKMGGAGSNGAQGGIAGGNNAPAKPAASKSKAAPTASEAAPIASEAGVRLASSPSETTPASDEPRMSILPIEGDGPTMTMPPIKETDTPPVAGPTVTTPPIMDTDTPTVEPEDQENPQGPAGDRMAEEPVMTKAPRPKKGRPTTPMAEAGAEPTKSSHMCDDPAMTTSPLMNVNSHHVEPAEPPATDASKEEVPVEAAISQPSKAPNKEPKLGTDTTPDQPGMSLSVGDPLKQADGSATVTVTVYAPAPTTGTMEPEEMETVVEDETLEGEDVPDAPAARIKQGQAPPSQKEATLTGGEGEEIEGGGDMTEDADPVVQDNQVGANTKGGQVTPQPEASPTTEDVSDCLLNLNLATSQYERDLRRSRIRQRSGFIANIRR